MKKKKKAPSSKFLVPRYKLNDNIFFLIAFTLFTSFCSFKTNSQLTEIETVKRCNAHILIGDLSSARAEADTALKKYPLSTGLFEVAITVRARQGDYKEMMRAWDAYVKQVPEGKENFRLLEQMSWGILSHGHATTSPIIRAMAEIGAFQGNDAKGVEILLKGLRDRNAIVRAIAVQLASELRDQPICDVFLQLLEKEKVGGIRLAVIKGVGTMQLKSAKKTLLALIDNDHVIAEEKATAIEALVNIFDSIDRKELRTLVTSDRAGLRQLGCKIVQHLDQKDAMDLIFPLIHDHSAEVRAAALTTIGLLHVESIGGRPIVDAIAFTLDDPSAQVAITAAWLMTLHHSEKGAVAFKKWLNYADQEIRIMAAAALSATGNEGNELSWNEFKQQKDPYVQLNLALGLIGRRYHTNAAGQVLHQALMVQKDKWNWGEYGIFRAVIPIQLQAAKELTHDVEIENQLIRLELLNILALVDPTNAQSAIRNFLGTNHWGVTGVASLLLLQEGDESAIEIVRGFLADKNPSIRVQAALALALWGRDRGALQVLEEAYPTADRQLKEKILEAIGHTGTRESIPFLIDRLKEPYQTLRLIAASDIVAILNN
jgi:HEAT repeat protein